MAVGGLQQRGIELDRQRRSIGPRHFRCGFRAIEHPQFGYEPRRPGNSNCRAIAIANASERAAFERAHGDRIGCDLAFVARGALADT